MTLFWKGLNHALFSDDDTDTEGRPEWSWSFKSQTDAQSWNDPQTGSWHILLSASCSKGIEKNRLVYEGYSFLQPITHNHTAEGRQQNRRVDFKILEK